MRNAKINILVILTLLMYFGACSKNNPTTPGGMKLYVVGGIGRYQGYYSDSFYCDEYVSVTNGAVVPTVMINDQELEFDYYGNSFHYYRDFPLVPRTMYSLVVTAGSNKAYATVYLPGDFDIIAPDSDYVLPKGSSLNVLWGSALYADNYWVDLYVHYEYRDTYGEYQFFSLSIDTIISGNSIAFSGNYIFPNLSEIDTLYWGAGFLSIYAIDGPALVPGSVGNVTGDGIGFFWAQQFRDSRFYVGSVWKISEEDLAKRRREALEKQKELWEKRIERLD
jgi:hypothetical protein